MGLTERTEAEFSEITKIDPEDGLQLKWEENSSDAGNDLAAPLIRWASRPEPSSVTALGKGELFIASGI
jgi:hypothetical protein